MQMTEPVIKALRTTYKGIHFRSRLEARWAVVFDTLHTPWQYEPEGFSIPDSPAIWHCVRHDQYGQRFIDDGCVQQAEIVPGRCYLPDFYLPEIRAYFEVKGEKPSELVQDQLQSFGFMVNKKVLLAIGELPDVPNTAEYIPYHIDQVSPYWDGPFEFARCSKCRQLGCVFSGYSDRICHCVSDHKGADGGEEVAAAYQVARAYSFWEPNPNA